MIKFSVRLDGKTFDRIDFDKKQVRKGMRKVGQKVSSDARRLVARHAIQQPMGMGERWFVHVGSKPGEHPARFTGELRKATKFRVSRSGFLVSIEPRVTSATTRAGEFYPAILYYGVRRGARRSKNHKKQQATGPWRIAPRENWTVDAAENRRAWAQQAIAEGLRAALKIN